MAEQIELSNEQTLRLVDTFGSPLYVYDERILRKRCRELRSLLPLPGYRPLYSVKANSNPALLRIIREEGFFVDAMSPGEIFLEGILMSADSLSQLERFGSLYPGREIGVRLNPGIGAGHDEKVVTGGSCKFGIEYEKIPEILKTAGAHDLRIVAINQHVGSLFLDYGTFLEACRRMLAIAPAFPDLRIIDFGGGYGVPYRGEERLDLSGLSRELTELVRNFLADCGSPDIRFYTESGRYIVAECCELLGTVQSRKEVAGVRYLGTDLGFNVLIRPVLYDAWHEAEVFSRRPAAGTPEYELVQIAGNICESGDILARDRRLPVTCHGDVIGIKNAGAYGYSMASCYNSRLRPAEVLLTEAGEAKLIRRRDCLEDLMRGVIL